MHTGLFQRPGDFHLPRPERVGSLEGREHLPCILRYLAGQMPAFIPANSAPQEHVFCLCRPLRMAEPSRRSLQRFSYAGSLLAPRAYPLPHNLGVGLRPDKEIEYNPDRCDVTSRLWFTFFILNLILGLGWWALGVEAAPPAQIGFATPTPRSDGRIIYIVQSEDNCLRISLLTGVSVDDLIRNNRLDSACTIYPGQELILGFGATATASPTAGPSPTATIAGPTPTPIAGGMGTVCLLIFNDLNGDGLRQENELGVAGGAVSITSADGLYSRSETTVAESDAATGEPVRVCFSEVPMGEYTVSAAAPEGYNPTTSLSDSLIVIAGDIVNVAFGVQEQSLSPAATSDSRSPLLGIGGVLLILGGIGLAIFASRTGKR